MPDENRMEKRQRVLADFGEFALRSDDLDAVLTEACRLVADALGTGRAKVLEITDDGRTLFVRSGVGWDKGIVGCVCLAMAEASSETYSIAAGEPVITNDLASEDRFDFPAFMREAGVKALANVPILLPGGRPFGLLQVDAREPRPFRDEDTQFLRTYATILGPVIDRLITMQALGATEERFRTIVEAARDYAIFLTDPQDRITDWLPGAEAVFGWTAAEAIGQPGAILYTPEDRQAGIPEADVKSARENGSAPNIRWHLRKDGSRVFIECSVVALRTATGELRGFQKIGQDVTKRHLAEEALRESEELRRIALESGGMGAWRWDTRDRSLRADDVVQRLWGVKASHQPHRISTYADLMYPEGAAWLEAVMTKEIAPGEAFHSQEQVASGPTAGRWVQLRGRAERDKPWIINGVSFDITEQRLAEQKLRDSEERYRNVLNSMAEGFALLGPDFTILDVNQETLRLDGRRRDELVGRTHWDAFPGTQNSPVGALLETVMQDRQPRSLEHRYVWPDGRDLWLDMRVYPTRGGGGGVAIFWRDITDRRRADEALRASEQRYRSLFESMDEAYAVIEVLKGQDGTWTDFRFLEVNPAFLAHTAMRYPVGKTATELIGTPNPRWARMYGQALDTGEALRVEETEATLGRTFDLNIFSLDRQHNRVAVLFTNITERKRGEEALRASEAKLQVLVAELQHRTRNLLEVVSGVAQQTLEASGSLQEFGSHFDLRLAALGRVQGLLSRTVGLEVSLSELVALELSAHGITDRTVAGASKVTMNGPEVRLPARIVQTLALALHELMTNALKHGAFSAPLGRLSITWSETEGSGASPGRHLWLHWSETGVDPVKHEPPRHGFGQELIETILPYELDARTNLTYGPDGVTCSIDLPLED
ncbi:PAS domain S-box protein [Azospirillum endophyticum]